MHREHGAGHWVVQHGNGPSRRTAGQMVGEITARYSTRDSLPPAWPPNSPDQNLLGNLWGWLDQRLDSLGCESFNTYSKAVSQQLAVVPTAPLRSLVECVPRRMAEVIRLKGEEIKYGGGVVWDVPGQPVTVRFKMRGTAVLSASGLSNLMHGHYHE